MAKILIVEDEPSLRQALADKLSKEGFEVLEAGDGQQGLDVALGQQPNLILLDIVMPVMDGISMLKALRADSRGQEVPVIILSNLTEAEKTAEALEQGVRDYLIKTDWTLEQLIQKIKGKLEKK